jgi:sugar/nucleoside kinase (ribokinase family)
MERIWAMSFSSRRWLAEKVKPVDTVGAGDCFTDWLATGIAEGMTMPTP